MKVLTLHQPWASLIALGVKQIETRSWRAPESLIGQRFAIHAAARKPDLSWEGGEWAVARETASNFLGGDLPDETFLYRRYLHDRVDLPLGCIVATAVLDDCVPMVEYGPTFVSPCLTLDMPHEGELRHQQGGMWLFGGTPTRVEDQRPYGLYEPGRWAWLLRDVEPFGPDHPYAATTGPCPRCGAAEMFVHAAGRSRWCDPCNAKWTPEDFDHPIPFKGGQGLSREWTP